jgi:hypothetical protein
MLIKPILENFPFLFTRSEGYPGFFEFLVLTFTGWVMYLVIDFGVVYKSAPGIHFRDIMCLYWEINFVEIIVSFILIFVLSYLYISGSLDEFLTLIRINVKFNSNTEIKALLLGFYLKLISVLIRKFTSPVRIQLDGAASVTEDGYPDGRKTGKKKILFKNKS